MSRPPRGTSRDLYGAGPLSKKEGEPDDSLLLFQTKNPTHQTAPPWLPLFFGEGAGE